MLYRVFGLARRLVFWLISVWRKLKISQSKRTISGSPGFLRYGTGVFPQLSGLLKGDFTIFSFQKIKELHETATIAFVAWNSTE